MAENPLINDTFSDLNFFITGASGFIGKVLLEKLLRSCPKIDKIYLLLRSKKGQNFENRLKEITEIPLFDSLKEQNPKIIDQKIRIIEGDISKPNLGISEEDRKMLIDNVSVVFHNAATVHFNTPLKDAILVNSRSTRDVVALAKQMRKIKKNHRLEQFEKIIELNFKVFLHVSTAYSNCDRESIKEELYPAQGDWNECIAMAETMDPYIIDVLTEKFIDPYPNTYTFSKNLAEHIVFDLCQDEIPAIIYRPSIVISSLNDPIPGWIDNFNGPIGILIACGKGLMRSCYCPDNTSTDYIPVDVAVRGIILATYEKLIRNHKKVVFYNCASYTSQDITMKKTIELARSLRWDVPMGDILWYPEGSTTNYRFLHYLNVIFLHLIPAIFVDLFFKMTKKKPILIKIQRRAYMATIAINYFMIRRWRFVNTNFLSLRDLINDKDLPNFDYDLNNIDPLSFFKNAMIGSRKYLLKDYQSEKTIEHDRRRMKKLYYLYVATNGLFYLLSMWILILKILPRLFS